MFNFSDCKKFQIPLLPSVYGFEFVLALTGNLLALWLMVVRERRNWHSGVILSCNLAISDLLYVLTLPLLIVYYSGGKHWMFGNTLCKIERFLFTFNFYVSISFIMAISVNRCVALVWPFFARAHIQPFHTKAISIIIWISVGLISCPVLKFASVCVDNNKTHCVSICETQNIGTDVTLHFVYKILLFLFGCLIPFVITSTCYCAVIWVVWRNVNITALEKQKVALLVTLVLVLYAVSFMPYSILQILHFHQKSLHKLISSQCLVYDMYQVSEGLAALNMCIHPILYMALFDSIRVVCCGKRLEDDNKIETSPQTHL